MARGWESKSVEDQIDSAQAAREARAKPYLSLAQREREDRKQSLLLSRSQIINRLKITSNARYRAQLQSALEHLEDQLRECEGTE